MSNVAIIAAHPDDETLGCAGTILKHRRNRDTVYWIIATRMHQSLGFSKAEIRKRDKEIAAVAHRYGFKKTFPLGFPAAGLDTVPLKELIKPLADIFSAIKPEIIYLPFRSDVHSDHRKIFEAAYSCTKIFRYPFIKKILMMETISETEFAPAIKGRTFYPNHFVDITAFFHKKQRIMLLYGGETGRHPFPRSLKNIEALAVLRGATAGCKYAESFMILKSVW